jgi:hypothetical protein
VNKFLLEEVFIGKQIYLKLVDFPGNLKLVDFLGNLKLVDFPGNLINMIIINHCNFSPSP